MIIPAYNAERYIAETLASVLAQTHAPTRVIVVNDGSTDGTAALVESIIQGYSGPIKIQLENKPNGGPSAARNVGIAKSTASYLAFLDADDVWHPRKLEMQLDLFEKDPSLVLVYCGHQVIDEQGIPQPQLHNHGEMPQGMIFDRLLTGNLVNASASAAIVDRKCFERLGVFDEALRSAEDWDMWLRIAQHYPIGRTLEPLVSIRHHSQNAQWDTATMLGGLLGFCIKWFQAACKRPEILKLWGHLLAELVLRAKDPKKAKEHVEQGLTAEMKQAFFRRTLGSLDLYLRLKRMRQVIK